MRNVEKCEMREKKKKILLERVGDQGEDLLVLVQQQHDAEVSEPLVSEARGGHELDALHLAELGRIAKHVDVQQLGHVPVAVVSISLLERGADRGRFLGNNLTLFIGSLIHNWSENEKKNKIKSNKNKNKIKIKEIQKKLIKVKRNSKLKGKKDSDLAVTDDLDQVFQFIGHLLPIKSPAKIQNEKIG